MIELMNEERVYMEYGCSCCDDGDCFCDNGYDPGA